MVQTSRKSRPAEIQERFQRSRPKDHSRDSARQRFVSQKQLTYYSLIFLVIGSAFSAALTDDGKDEHKNALHSPCSPSTAVLCKRNEIHGKSSPASTLPCLSTKVPRARNTSAESAICQSTKWRRKREGCYCFKILFCGAPS